jgi:hypothetical protein
MELSTADLMVYLALRYYTTHASPTCRNNIRVTIENICDVMGGLLDAVLLPLLTDKSPKQLRQTTTKRVLGRIYRAADQTIGFRNPQNGFSNSKNQVSESKQSGVGSQVTGSDPQHKWVP